MFIDCHYFILGGYKFRLPAQIDASGWILVWNLPARCSSASTSFLFFLFLCHKEIKTLNRLHEHKKGKEEQETGTWILWGGSAVGRLFIFFISGSENFGAGPILFQTLLFAVFGNAWIANGSGLCLCIHPSTDARTHTYTKIKGKSSKETRGKKRQKENKKQPK